LSLRGTARQTLLKGGWQLAVMHSSTGGYAQKEARVAFLSFSLSGSGMAVKAKTGSVTAVKQAEFAGELIRQLI